MSRPSTPDIISICVSHSRSTRASFPPRRAPPLIVKSGNMRNIVAVRFVEGLQAVGEMPDFFRLARAVSENDLSGKIARCGSARLGGVFPVKWNSLLDRDMSVDLSFFMRRACLICLTSTARSTNGVVIYAFLGYDPGLHDFSVGTDSAVACSGASIRRTFISFF